MPKVIVTIILVIVIIFAIFIAPILKIIKKHKENTILNNEYKKAKEEEKARKKGE